MLAPRFDLIDVESRFDENHEIFQIHLGDCMGVRLFVNVGDSFAEGIGSDGDAIAGGGRKLQVRAGTRGNGGLQARP